MLDLKNTYSNLLQFIYEIRVWEEFDHDKFNARFQLHWINKTEKITEELSLFTNEVFEHAFFVNVLTEHGINSNNGFFSEIVSKLKHKILPIEIEDNELINYINFIFDSSSDYIWLNKIDNENWKLIFVEISKHVRDSNKKVNIQICNSLTILSNRLTTLGIDRSLSEKFPSIDDLGSPFFNLGVQLEMAIKISTSLENKEFDVALSNEIFFSINQIEDLFINIQNDIKETGTSLNLIYLLRRAQQHIERIKLLVNILLEQENDTYIKNISTLIKQLVESEKLKNDIVQFFKSNTQLLAFRIVSHTSKKGENYIGFSKLENKALFKSAMGGGLVVVLLVYIKHLIHQLHLSLFIEGLLFGLNYGIGFVFMHLLHFTLATKQPAMTASFIAESLAQNSVNKNQSFLVFKQIINSQMISLIGNLVVVIPLCFASSFFVYYFWNIHIFNEKETLGAFYNNHLFYSLALVYACFTGLFLSISGMLTGYIDNKVVFSKIAKRIEKHPRLVPLYGIEKRKQIADFFEKNLGAIVGNLFLGFCLGMAGNLGEFIGIPFDIRHITISAGNYSIALSNMYVKNLALILTSFVTVILIGLINIMVSFMVSFILACSSRGLSWNQSIRILFNR
ncbi:MAG TPA: hypothetical protein PK323_04275 [Bacteroidia bacterium]|nr:hypothetical protein [Bacteroidia bacterium]